MGKGDAARQFAAAPLRSETNDQPAPNADQTPMQPQAQPEKVNPFCQIFPVDRVVFKMNLQDAGKPWNNGTISQTLADAIIPLGETGAYITTARIVRLTLPNGGGTKLDLQMPSSGGSYKRPMIDASGDETSKANLIGWRKLVADRFVGWRQAGIAAGTATTVKGQATSQGLNVDDEMMKALGLG